jgi:Tol biopolymer transport system component
MNENHGFKGVDPVDYIADDFEEITMDIEYRRELLAKTSGIVATRHPRLVWRWMAVAAAASAAAALIAFAALIESRPASHTVQALIPKVQVAPVTIANHGAKPSAAHIRPTLPAPRLASASVPPVPRANSPFRAVTSAHAAPGPFVAVVTFASQTLRDDAGHALAPGNRIRTGVGIDTDAGGRATLVTRKGSAITLAAGTRLVFTSPGVAALSSGRIYCRNRNKEIASIDTPAGRIKLLGTVLDADVLKGNAVAVTVVEGKVRLSNSHGEALVGAGSRSVLAAYDMPESGVPVDTFAETAWYQGKGEYQSDYGDIAYSEKPNDLLTEIWVEKSDGSGRRRVASFLGWVQDTGPWFPQERWIHVGVTSVLWNKPDDATRTANAGAGFPVTKDEDLLLDTATGQTAPVDIPDDYNPLYLCFAPNPELAAFCGTYYPHGRGNFSDVQGGVWLVDRRTGKLTKLLSGAIKTAPAWSPDGREIAISTAEGYTNNHRLAIVDVRSGNVRDLGINGAGACFSPDGTKIAYSGGFDTSSSGGSWMAGVPKSGAVYVLGLAAGATPVRVSRAGEGAYEAQFSPDGSRVLYVTSDDRVCVAKADGSAVTDVYQGKPAEWDVFIEKASWDASGKSIFLTANDKDKTDVYVIAADGSSAPRQLNFAGGDALLTPAARQQTVAAVAAVKEAVYDYAKAQIDQFEGNIADMRKSCASASDIFAGLVWNEPLSGIGADEANRYGDAVANDVSGSDADLLEGACKERMLYLGNILADAAAARHQFPPDIPTALKWAAHAGWGIDWLDSNDIEHLAMVGMCPGDASHGPEQYVYAGPKDGSEPSIGETIATCPLHPNESVVWSSEFDWTLHQLVMRNGSPGDWRPIGYGLDTPYRFQNVGDGGLTITHNMIGDNYKIEGKAVLLPTGKVYADQTISLGALDEGSVARAIDSAGAPDWGTLPANEVSIATSQLAFCRAVAEVEAGKPITNWDKVFDGEPGTLLYQGPSGGSCGAFDSDLRFDLIGPGAIELYQLEPSGRFHVSGTVKVESTGEVCKNGLIDKDGHVIPSAK